MRVYKIIDAGEWARYGAWMLENQLVTKPPFAQHAFTNEFLPGQGLEANTAEPQSGGG